MQVALSMLSSVLRWAGFVADTVRSARRGPAAVAAAPLSSAVRWNGQWSMLLETCKHNIAVEPFQSKQTGGILAGKGRLGQATSGGARLRLQGGRVD